jgi:hypothetical protein
MSFTVASNKTASVRLMQRRNADVVAAPFGATRVMFNVEQLANTSSFDLHSYIAVPEKSDIYVEAIAFTNPASVAARFDLILDL